jgi:hypothetical protein
MRKPPLTFAVFIISLVITVFQIILFSCTKPGDDHSRIEQPPFQADTTKPTVNSTWQCTIDGANYSGVIDTSFFQMDFVPVDPDSIIVSTGTSADQKAHIHFKMIIDRTKFPSTGTNNIARSFLIFDTAANNILRSDQTLQPYHVVNYKIDSITGTNLVVSYSGMLTDSKLQTHAINGKFSCKLNTGSNDPNKFYCLIDSGKRAGYFTSASVNANTLIMHGMDYMDANHREFKLLVRTGGTIKPGVYKSSNGDVSFNSMVPEPYGLYSTVDDSLGNMTITIQSVTDNVVRGAFSGTDDTGFPIDSGGFVCHVTDYVPQQDSSNRWKCSLWTGQLNDGNYSCYAGNILSAVKTTTNGRNYLTINGESDHGASVFRIVLNSTSPIIRGPYLGNQGGPDNILDSLYFKSGVATWNGTIPYLYSDERTFGSGAETDVYIDYIDDKKVTGTFYGSIFNNLEDVIFGPGYSGAKMIKKASFTANF